ncbi:MAG: DUF58 domain-containing protein [Bacteroidales bacterium]|nr:DUF58 domain-containing protein [Bacteroidales bacterium]
MPIEVSNIAQLGSLEFLARQIVEGFITGLHKSPFHGFSVEFAEHRLYNTGEPTKNINWKLYARTEKLFVKRYEEETNLRCQIVIDKSSSMYFPVKNKLDFNNLNKLWFSIYSSAALIEMMRRQRDAVGLSTFDKDIALHTPAKLSRVHLNMIYNELEKLMLPYEKKDMCQTDTVQCLHKIAEMTHKRSLVIIFSDMFDNLDNSKEMFAALEHLRYNKHEVILFHVFDSLLEEKLEYENRPHRFVDLETGETLKLNPVEIKEKYETIMLAKKEELLRHCYQYQIDYVEADINKSYNQILTSYLIKRSKIS